MTGRPNVASTARRRVEYTNTCMLAVAGILILLPIITVPSTPLYLFKADNPSVEVLGGFPEVTFGAFGYCVDITPNSKTDTYYPRSCSSIQLGYDSSKLEYSGPAGHKTFSIAHYTITASPSSIAVHTRFMILYPFALCMVVYAAVSSGVARSRWNYAGAAVGSVLGFICMVILVAIDFTALRLVEKDYVVNPINGNRPGRSSVGAGPITTMVAMVLLFFSSMWSLTFYLIERALSTQRSGDPTAGQGHVYAPRSSFSSDEYEKLDEVVRSK